MFFVSSSFFYAVIPSLPAQAGEARNLSSILAAADNDLQHKHKKGTS